MEIGDTVSLVREFFETYEITPLSDHPTDTEFVDVAQRSFSLWREEVNEALTAERYFLDVFKTADYEAIANALVDVVQEYVDVRYVVAYGLIALRLPTDVESEPAAEIDLTEIMDEVIDAFEWYYTAFGLADFHEAAAELARTLLVLDGYVAAIADSGVPLAQAFHIVHKANLDKVWPDGKIHRNETGKILKPPGWEGPRRKLRELLFSG